MGYIKSLGFMLGESYPSSRSVYLRYWCRGSSERAQSTRKKKKQSSQFFTKTHIFTQVIQFLFCKPWETLLNEESSFLSIENIRLAHIAKGKLDPTFVVLPVREKITTTQKQVYGNLGSKKGILCLFYWAFLFKKNYYKLKGSLLQSLSKL